MRPTAFVTLGILISKVNDVVARAFTLLVSRFLLLDLLVTTPYSASLQHPNLHKSAVTAYVLPCKMLVGFCEAA